MEDKPTSIRAIRKLRKLQPRVQEGTKTTVIIRGNKSSTQVMSFLKDIRSLRKQNSVMFARKHEIHPFENRSELQSYCKKTNCSLFLFGSHNKKRPNNIVIGRTYEHQVLDMVELGMHDYNSIADIVTNAQIPNNVHPFLVFQGDLWETQESFKKLRNLLNDFFLMNQKPKGIEIDKAMTIVVCFSATEDQQIYLRTYEVAIEGKNLFEDEGKIIVQQLGPNARFNIRRSFFADNDTWKKATHIPKPKKKKQNKNVHIDSLGNKRGKLYVDRQDLNRVPIKRRRLISKGEGKKKLSKEEVSRKQKNENEFAP